MIKKIIVLISLITFSTNYIFANPNNLIIVKDLEAHQFIKELMAPILASAGVDPASINIYIVNNATPNAFVYNGQNIFVHTGLITFADNAQEIAGILAHELAHISLGHLSRGEAAYSKANLLVMLGLGASILAALLLANSSSTANEGASDIVAFLGASANNVALSLALAYSKAEESQADQLALAYLQNTPYGTEAMLGFMNKIYNLEDKEFENHPFAWYTTHPATQTRVNFFKNNLLRAQNNKHNKNINTKFLLLKAKIIAYNNPNQIKLFYTNPNQLDSMYANAIAYSVNNEYDLAISLLNTLLLNTNINKIYIADILGDIYYQKQNFTDSIKYYSQVINSNISDKDIIYFKLAKSHYAAQLYNNAYANLVTSLTINSKNPAAWYLKSLVMGKQNRTGEANLALAEYYFLLEEYRVASEFVTKAILNLNNQSNQSDYQNALLLLAQINKKLK